MLMEGGTLCPDVFDNEDVYKMIELVLWFDQVALRKLKNIDRKSNKNASSHTPFTLCLLIL